MNKRNIPEDKLDRILTELPGIARNPSDKFSAEAGYHKLKPRLTAPKSRRLSFMKYVAAACVLFMIAFSTYLFNSMGKIEMITIATTDQIEQVVLPDGTIVTLSYHSQLNYPHKFEGDKRQVSLSGEAYFDVHKDREHPFVVESGEVMIEVLGTQFNVSSYPLNSFIKTTLIEGSVAIRNTQNEHQVILKPNESATFDKTMAAFSQEFLNKPEVNIAWQSGKLIFENQTLEEISIVLSNYFNVEIEITNPELKNYRLNARFENQEGLDKILTLLQSAGNFIWDKTPHSIIIYPN